MNAAKSDKKYDVGVLLVHGIGHNKKGDTLVRFGEAIVNWINNWTSNEPKPEQQGPPSPPSANVSVGDVVLRDQIGSPSGPAYAEVTLSNVKKKSEQIDGESKWLLAESWWAETFPTPRYVDIANWAFRILPWTIITHFDRRIVRAGFYTRNAHSPWDYIDQFMHWIFNFFWLLTALFLLPFVFILILVLLIVGLLPIPNVRSFIAKIQRGISTTIGDSFVLLGCPFAAGAILTKTRHDLKWLAERCDHVAIIAHSQGAAIAHKVVRLDPKRPDPKTPCDLLVTFGSGLKKLSEVERAMERGGSGLVWLAVLFYFFSVASLVALSMILPDLSQAVLLAALIVVAGGVLYGCWWLSKEMIEESEKLPISSSGIISDFVKFVFLATYLLFTWWIAGLSHFTPSFPWSAWSGIAPSSLLKMNCMLFALFFLSGKLALNKWRRQAWKTFRNEHIFQEYFSLNRPETRWLDIYASADPIPNGPLLDLLIPDKEFIPNEFLDSLEVNNRGSLFTDHVAYWKNREEFIASIVQEIAELADIEVTDGKNDKFRLEVSRMRRHWRVLWLTVARRVLAVLGIIIALGWQYNPPKKYLGRIVESIQEYANILAVMSILITVYYLMYLVWLKWEEVDYKRFIEGNDYRRLEFSFVLFLCLFIFAVVLPGALTLNEMLNLPFYSVFIAIAGMIALVVFKPELIKRVRVGAVAGPVQEAFERAEELEIADLKDGIKDGSALAAYQYAKILEKQGDKDKASEYYKKAVEFE